VELISEDFRHYGVCRRICFNYFNLWEQKNKVDNTTFVVKNYNKKCKIFHRDSFDFSKKFDVVANILDANVTPQQGRLLLSIRGEEEVVEQGLAWVSEQGVIVERWAGLDGQGLVSPR